MAVAVHPHGALLPSVETLTDWGGAAVPVIRRKRIVQPCVACGAHLASDSIRLGYRYCHQCHPAAEEEPEPIAGTCLHGHDLAEHGRPRPGRSTPWCQACDSERKRAARRRRAAAA